MHPLLTYSVVYDAKIFIIDDAVARDAAIKFESSGVTYVNIVYYYPVSEGKIQILLVSYSTIQTDLF